MDGRLLNSSHKNSENFSISTSVENKNSSPSWNNNLKSNCGGSPQSDGTVEDYKTTLSNWRRHVASLPMSDCEDYVSTDLFQETPSPCKTERFFTPADHNQYKSDYDSSTEIISEQNSSVNCKKVKGDNRHINDDNTSISGMLYQSVESVVYEVDGDSPHKYIAYQYNEGNLEHYIPHSIEVIAVDPESLDVLDSSSCDYDSDELESDESEDNPQDIDVLGGSLKEIDSQHGSNQEENLHPDNDNLSVNLGMNYRNVVKSTSLPPSPSRPELEAGYFDYQTSFTFEDLKSADIERMLVNPLKVFNKNFDSHDTGCGSEPSLTDNIVFDPVIPLNVKSNKDSNIVNDFQTKINKIKLENPDIDVDVVNNIIDKNEMIEKVMNSSDLLFNSEMGDPTLTGAIDNFNLPKFIMSESPIQSSVLCSPIMGLQTPESVTRVGRSTLTLGSSTPKAMFEKTHTTPISSKSSLFNGGLLSLGKFSKDISNGQTSNITNNIKCEPVQKGLNDTDDDIDVETVSDGENIPVLAANNLDSLLEQFEANENMQKKGSSNEIARKTIIESSNEKIDNSSENHGFKSVYLPESKSVSVSLDHDYCSPVKIHDWTSHNIANCSDSVHTEASCGFSNNSTSNSIVKIKLEHGIGKNIALCMEYRTDEFKSIESDNKYSEPHEVDGLPQNKITVVNNTSGNYINPIEKIVDVSCARNVKKSVVVSFAPNQSLLNKDLSSNNSEGFGNSGKKVSGEYTMVKSGNINPLGKNKQSLLKPAVKEEIKMASLLKKESVNNSRETTAEIVKPKVKEIVSNVSVEVTNNNSHVIPFNDTSVPLKKKLNLEEYKKRRGTAVRSCEGSRVSSPIGMLATDLKTYSSPNSPVHREESNSNVAGSTESTTTPVKVSAVTCMSISSNKDLKQPFDSTIKSESDVKLFDPIAEATRKALQLKKMASQKCSEDEIISRKIPKLDNVVILPMATKNGVLLPMTKKADEDTINDEVVPPVKRKNSQYEEIVMVSIGVNTEPVAHSLLSLDVNSKTADKPSKSIQFKIAKKENILLQRNVFGTANEEDGSYKDAKCVEENENINNLNTEDCATGGDQNNKTNDVKINESVIKLNETLQNAEKLKDFKITNNSLIASIQKVVNKKRNLHCCRELESISKPPKMLKSNSQKEITNNFALNSTAKFNSGVESETPKQECNTSDQIVDEHGEDKIIMHLKKDRVKPLVHTAYCQTDISLLVKDTEVDVKPNSTSRVFDANVLHKEENVNNEQTNNRRQYRRRQSRSSSNEHSFRNTSDYKTNRKYSDSSTGTRGTERSRRSYSPVRRRIRSRSRSRSRRSGRYRRDRRNSRSRDSRYSRKSRSCSGDRKGRSSRSWRRSEKSYSPVKNRCRSKSRDRYSDNRSVRSLPLTASQNGRMSGGSYERYRKSSHSRSRSRSRSCHRNDRVTTNVPECAEGLVKDNGERTRTYSESSTSSNSSTGSSSSSSATSSSSSSCSSRSSVFYSDNQNNKSPYSSRHPSPVHIKNNPRSVSPRKVEPMEERRVVFVGKLEKTITKDQMRKMFSRFGHIREVTLHRKEDGSRYGFVTFAKAQHSFHVVESANKDPELHRYDVSFGGRRAFCRHLYADLDDLETLEEPEYYGNVVNPELITVQKESSNFDALLQQMKKAAEAKQRAKQKSTTSKS